jgi:hypothetical protein
VANVPVIDVSDVVAALSEGTYTFTNYAQGSYDANGIAVKGAASSFSVPASVQVIAGRELQRLSEGRRNEEWIKIFVLRQLFTEGTGSGASYVSFNGENFEVDKSYRKDGYGGYFEYHAKLVPRIGQG